MHWLSGVAIPEDAALEDKNLVYAIREEFASYDYCSNCYKGSYLFNGKAIQGSLDAGSNRVFLVGTWSCWSTFEEMIRTDDDTYVGEVKLGDTRFEKFNLAINEDSQRIFYPLAKQAGMNVHIAGPSANSAGRSWLIDGRKDGWPSGARYKVTFRWDRQKSISWEPIEDSKAESSSWSSRAKAKHFYYILGSMTSWQPVRMTKDPTDEAAWVFNCQLLKNLEEFRFIRDNDPNQAIYPLGESLTARTPSWAQPKAGRTRRGGSRSARANRSLFAWASQTAISRYQFQVIMLLPKNGLASLGARETSTSSQVLGTISA